MSKKSTETNMKMQTVFICNTCTRLVFNWSIDQGCLIPLKVYDFVETAQNASGNYCILHLVHLIFKGFIKFQSNKMHFMQPFRKGMHFVLLRIVWD